MSKRMRVDDRFTIELASPSAERVAELAREGFRSIVNLRTPGEKDEILSPSAEGDLVRSHGLEYVSVPISPQEMNETSAERFEQAIANLPGPVAVHCASGKRAGLFTYMHVARIEGLSGDSAAAKAESMGFQFGTPELKALFTRYVDSGKKISGGPS